jgi:hypothetical protein
MAQLCVRSRFVFGLLKRFGCTRNLSFKFFVPQFACDGDFIVKRAQALPVDSWDTAILGHSINDRDRSGNEKVVELHNGLTKLLMSDDAPFHAEHLAFPTVSYGAAHVLAAKCSSTLRTLDLSLDAFLDREEVSEFADVIVRLGALETLEITDRKFGMRVTSFSLLPLLCRAIEHCPSLQHAIINSGCDEPEAYAELGRVLPHANVVITLELDDILSATGEFLSAGPLRDVVPHLCKFSATVDTAEDCERLARVLPACCKMQTLEIRSCVWKRTRFEPASNVVLKAAAKCAIDVVDGFLDCTFDEDSDDNGDL